MKYRLHRIEIGVLTLLVGVSVSVAWAGWPHHRMRPTPQHGIPDRDYDYPQFSDPARVLSRPAVPLVLDSTPEKIIEGVTDAKAAESPNARTAPISTPKPFQRKLFQLDKPRVRIDHCEVSRFSLVIDQNGHWLLTAMGEQGVEEEPAAGDQMAERQLAVLPLRNQFRLCVRGYPATTAVGDAELEALGRPVLFQLPAQTFWVQREKTQPVRASGISKDVENAFPLIERIELEFAYR